MKITLADLHMIAGNKTRSKVATEFVTVFNELADAHEINTVKRVAFFLANTVPETGGFTKLSESLNYSVVGLLKGFGRHRISKADAEKYGRSGSRKANQKAIANIVYGGKWGEDNLGNIQAGDGWKFRGAGPGQATGRANFARAEALTGIPFTTEPERMSTVRDGLSATLALWSDWGMNKFADSDSVTVGRKKWNGGTNGLNETLEAWRRGIKLSFNADGSEPVVQNPSSKILPLYRPKQTDEVTRLVLDKFNNDATSDGVRVLVVRGYYQDSMGVKGRNDRAMYDDAVFVVTQDGVQAFNGNSDPSVYRKSVATLKAPQVIIYKPGLHGYSRKAGPYPAFRQHSLVTVVRDKVGDDHGMFHINFHRGGVNGTSSLGCLTIPLHQWNEFYDLVKGLLERYNQETFTVTLVEYDGDNPPVTVPKKTEQNIPPVKTGAVAVVAVGVAVVSWWDNISTWIGSFF